MHIVADDNIPYAAEAFATLGRVTLVDGPNLTRAQLRDTDILCIRSTRRVTEDLLAGTPVRFVATASIGFDHVDLGYLRRKGIGFAAAPGSNANSVGEYVISALLAVGEARNISWPGCTMGLIGVGNVGSNVRAKIEALGMCPVLNDPPLFDRTNDPLYRPLAEVLACDVISLHVPLTATGPYPTRHLADDEFFRQVRRCRLFINTARGGVLDTAALRRAMAAGRVDDAVLDVHETEPQVRPEDVTGMTYVTPHIAGHSLDGKVDGTRQIYEAVGRFLDVAPVWPGPASLPPPAHRELRIDIGRTDRPAALAAAVMAAYDIRRDDAAFRRLLATRPGADGFQNFRKTYHVRREFPATRVRLTRPDPELAAAFQKLGFRTA
ncbi:MAG: 4-phosphoerythronate dehydrogenase [Acidobacteria bacterium]|nr:4-phosphoerythronate dehydrogenase [Acidobacteriota bacterium]